MMGPDLSEYEEWGRGDIEPIFDRSRVAAGWLRGNTVYDRAGTPLAFIDDRAVFSFDGAYLGRFDRPLFRDVRGCLVDSTRYPAGEAVLPTPLGWTRPPALADAPEPPQVSQAPVPAAPLLNWSCLSFGRFLRGYKAGWPWEHHDWTDDAT